MTPKEAYCCLHCSDQPNCCGPCGECEVCCKDCGDTSACKSTAFLDKNDKFYLRYNYSSSYSYTDSYFGTDDIDCDPDRGSQSVFTIGVRIPFEEAPLFNGIYSSSNYGECCGLNCCYAAIGGDQKSQTNTSIVNNFFQTETKGTPSKDYNDDCGVETTERSSGYYNGTVSIIDGDFCQCQLCVDEEYEEPHPWGKERGKTKSIGSGTVSYSQEVKLYNSNGEEIEDPWAIISYPRSFNPCDPIRNVSAPGCHFFAP